MPKMQSPGKDLYFPHSWIYLCLTISRPTEPPTLNRLLVTIFNSDGVCPCGKINVDDSVQFIEIASGRRTEPYQPRLLTHVECHLIVCCLGVTTDIRWPSDPLLSDWDSSWVSPLVDGPSIVSPVLDNLWAKLVVRASNSPARICRISGDEWRPSERIGPGEGLLVVIVISTIGARLDK